MHPRVGRSFNQADMEPGRDGVAIVSDAFWKSQLASAPDPLGRIISLDTRTYTVIGVMPEEFDFHLGTELWTPLALTPQEKSNRERTDLYVYGRLKPGTSMEQARAEITALSAELERRYPKTNRGHGVMIHPLRESIDQVTDRFTIILLGAATFVLLLACANVANLQLARSTARQREIGLRAALGASRFRIARELLTESLVIGMLGGSVGMLLAELGSAHYQGGYSSASFPLGGRAQDLAHGREHSSFRFRAVGGCGRGLLPSGHLSTAAPARPRRIERRAERRRTHLQLRNIPQPRAQHFGCSGSGALAGTPDRRRPDGKNLPAHPGPGSRLRSEEHADHGHLALRQELSRRRPDGALLHQVLDRLNAVPGVESAAGAGDIGGAATLSIEGQQAQPAIRAPTFSLSAPATSMPCVFPCAPDRSIGTGDGPNTAPVVVVSEAVSRHFWPGVNPIGRRIRLKGPGSPWLTVAGVCGDLKDWFSGNPQLAVYVSYQQWPTIYMGLHIRTRQDPLQFAASVRAQVRAVDRKPGDL